jgi:hypothetical protein
MVSAHKRRKGSRLRVVAWLTKVVDISATSPKDR